MPAIDPLKVHESRSIQPSDGFEKNQKRQQKTLSKLREMHRELPRILHAVRQLEHDVTFVGQRADAHGEKTNRSKHQLRDWLLSIIESQGYIETMMGGHAVNYDFKELCKRAVELGRDRAKNDGAPSN